MEYSNWANNQPDNHSDTFNRTEDCLQIWSSDVDRDRRWNDMACKNDVQADQYSIKPLCQLF